AHTVQITLDDRLPAAGTGAHDVDLPALARLSPVHARGVELRSFGGLSIDETARALDLSPATVKRHWTVARAFLRRERPGSPAAAWRSTRRRAPSTFRRRRSSVTGPLPVRSFSASFRDRRRRDATDRSSPLGAHRRPVRAGTLGPRRGSRRLARRRLRRRRTA